MDQTNHKLVPNACKCVGVKPSYSVTKTIQHSESSLPLTPLGVKMSLSAEEDVHLLRDQVKWANMKREAAERKTYEANMKIVALEGDKRRLKDQVKGLSSLRHIGPKFRLINKQNQQKFRLLRKRICLQEELISKLRGQILSINYCHGDLLADIKLQLESYEVKHLEVPIEMIPQEMNEDESTEDESTEDESTEDDSTESDTTEDESTEEESTEDELTDFVSELIGEKSKP